MNDVYEALGKVYRESGYKFRLRRVFYDNKLRLTTKALLMEAVDAADVDSDNYVADCYDCDNFAFSLVGSFNRLTGCNFVGFVVDYGGG